MRLPSPRLYMAAMVAGLVFVGAACGDGSSVELSEAGQRGRSVSASNGCASCHGSNGQGGSGPAWKGLAGSMVELDDGTTVVADDDYLSRAITDPAVEIRAGYALKMPVNNLDQSEINDVIAYIHDLGLEADPSD